MRDLSMATDAELSAYRRNMIRAGRSCPEVTKDVVGEIDREIRNRKAEKIREWAKGAEALAALLIGWVIISWIE